MSTENDEFYERETIKVQEDLMANKILSDHIKSMTGYCTKSKK